MNSPTETAYALDIQAVFKAFPGLHALLSPDFTVLAATDEFVAATLTSPEQLLGHNLFEAFPEVPDAPANSSASVIRQSLEYVLQNQKAQTIREYLRYDVLNQNGLYEEKHWSIRSKPVLTEQGTVPFILYTVEDVTQSVKQQEQEKLNNNNLQSYLDATGGVSWEYDLQNQRLYWSKNIEQIFGYSINGHGELPNFWDERVHPQDYPVLRQSLNQAIQQKEKAWTGRYRFKKANGTYTHVMDHGYILYGQDDQPYRMLGTLIDIDRQQKHERLAKETLERFELMAKATNDVIWDWNLVNNSIWWNDGFKQSFGYKDPEIELDINSWYSRIHPEDAERVVGSIHQVIDRGGSHWQSEYRFRRADGTYADIFDRGLIARDESGKPLRMIGAMLDITEKNRYAAKLKASNNRLTQVLDALPHMTFTTRPDGHVTYYSQQWYIFWGGNRQSLSAWAWEDYIHPDDEEATMAAWRNSLATGQNLVTEGRWLSPAEGKYRWFLMMAVPVKDAQGNISMWVGALTDIQEMKQAQLDLQKSTKQFQFLADSVPQLVWTTDPNGYHDYFNQQWVEYTGYDVESSMGTHMWNNLLHPEDRERSFARWQHSLQTGEPYEVEYRFKRAADGAWRWFLGRALPMRDQNGTIIRWFGTCTDIEEQKRDKELLAETNRELRSTNEDLDSFVYTASHDLKLPIINMGGIFNELLQCSTFHDPKAELLIGMFDKSLKQINTTISDLTEVVKVQKNINAHLEEVQLQELVEEINFSIKDMIEEAGATIHTDFSQIPSLTFSRANLKSVLYNLISNAIKYRSPERAPIVNLQTKRDAELVVLTVQDNGLGLNLDKHGTKVFQMFKRFHNHVPGSGLGLYIINRIVQKNGGRVEIESQEKVGTTFTLYLKQGS